MSDSNAPPRTPPDAVSGAVYRMSPDWHEMDLLDAGSLCTGAAATVRWWTDRTYPEDRPLIRAALAEAIRTRSVFDLEHRVRRADGTAGWIRSQAIPVLNADDEIVHWFGTATDVTARGDADTSRRHARAKEAFLLKLADALLPLADPVATAGVAARLLGEHLAVDRCFYAEVDRANDAPVVHHDPAGTDTINAIANLLPVGDRCTPLVCDALEEHPIFKSNAAACRARGVDGFILVPLLRRGAVVACMCVTTQAPRPWSAADVALVQEAADRTLSAVERAHADAALRDSEHKYRTLFENLGQGYAECELIRAADGHATDFRYVALNPAFERLSGLKVADTLGRTARETVATIEESQFGMYQQIVDTGVPARREYHVATLGRWYENHIYPGQGDRFFTLYDDITDRKRAEFVLRDSEERQAFLLELSDALRPIGDPAQIQRVATHMLGEHLNASRVFYVVVGEDGDTSDILADYTNGVPSRVGQYSLEAFSQYAVREWRAGRNASTGDVNADPRYSEAERAAYASVSTRAGFGIPLIKEGRLTALLGVNQAEPRDWSDYDIALAGEVAERTWSALARARAEMALRESEERLRQFGDASQDVLWIRATDTLQWQYLTPAFERVYGLSREEALAGDNHRNWLDLVIPEDRGRAKAMIDRVVAGEQVTFEYRIRRPSDGQIRLMRNTDFPIADARGKVVMIGGIGHDATDLHEAELRFRSLLEGIPQLVWRAVDGGHWTWASPQWTEFTGQAEADSHDFGWLDRVHPDDREAARRAWSHAMESGGFSVEYRLCNGDEGYSWFSTRATPVRDDSGTIVEWLGTSTDIHGLRQLQDRQRILLAELQHRVRNIMAMIRSVARRTSEGPVSVGDYIEHFEGRINAMARTQTLLTRAPGAGVDLQNLVRDELGAQAAKPMQYSCRGPDVALSPKAAEVLTLAVHELATNATKYGALGTPGGLVDIEWSKERRGELAWLRFDWTELRVTLPIDPERPKGFGTELVTRRVPYELKGRGTMDFRNTGLHARIEFPLVPGQSILQTDAGPEGVAIEKEVV